jgi:hypothetical protein
MYLTHMVTISSADTIPSSISSNALSLGFAIGALLLACF